ncbi:MAG: NADH-quinone oxidoreductase subunit NuoH [SAR202 cluster bacterium]|nr:NADH-quinone oxidoreductase subunit NuoH [SAR202 cluster bacterium]
MDFLTLYEFILNRLPESLDLEWLAFGIAAATLAFLVFNAVISATALYTWFERRVLARIQSRLGPNRWGPFGLLQPLADVLKLMVKEDTIPDDADRPLFHLAPIILLVPGLMVFAVIPFGEIPFEDGSFLGRLNIGILFIIGITGINALGVFIAGWASRNKYAMFGAMRGVAMLVSYEVPMALALTGVVIMSGSLALTDIVIGQNVIYLVTQPLGFLIFMTAASAEMSRTPFDMVESESELGSGFNTEYSGIKFALFFLGEFMAPLAVATVATVLYLGGTRGFDPIPGQIWFVLKAFMVILGLLWIRATWPRLRVDQIMGFAWKGLFPLALFNMFLVAVEVLVFQDPDTGAISTGELWLIAGINWVLTVVAVVVMAQVLGQKRLKRPVPVPSPLANMNAGSD